MEYLHKIFVFLAFFCLAESYIPNLYYLNEKCGYSLSFSNDVRIKLTRYPYSNLRRNLNCQLNMATRRTSDRLLVRFRSLDTQYSVYCNQNNLQLYDSNGNPLTGTTGLCGHSRPTKLYETTGNNINIAFTTDPIIYQTGNFEILITSFNYGSQNSTCNSGDYQCDNKKCIYSGLTCDGYNNCGDDSDEIDGCGLSTGILTGIGIGAFIFLVLIILGIICGRRRYYHHHHCHGTTTVTTTKSYQNF